MSAAAPVAPVQEEIKKDTLSPEQRARKDICEQLQITPEQLDSMKETFGKVEATRIAGRWFVYRALKRAELKMIRQGVQGGDDLIQEEKIAARCLVLPKCSEEQLRSDDAGLATTLTELIYNFSGYSPESIPLKI